MLAIMHIKFLKSHSKDDGLAFEYCTTASPFTEEEICGVLVLSTASSSSSLHLGRVNTAAAVSCVSILQPKAFSLCHSPAKPQDISYEDTFKINKFNPFPLQQTN